MQDGNISSSGKYVSFTIPVFQTGSGIRDLSSRDPIHQSVLVSTRYGGISSLKFTPPPPHSPPPSSPSHFSTHIFRGVSDTGKVLRNTEKPVGLREDRIRYAPEPRCGNLESLTSSRSDLNRIVLGRSSCSGTRPRFCVGYKAVRFQTRRARAYLKKDVF